MSWLFKDDGCDWVSSKEKPVTLLDDDKAYAQALSEFMHWLHMTFPVQLVGYPVDRSKFLSEKEYVTVINGMVVDAMGRMAPAMTKWDEAFNACAEWLERQPGKIIVWRVRPQGEKQRDLVKVRMRLHTMSHDQLKAFL